MRIQGWERRLAEFLEAERAQPFIWGQYDCAIRCAKWIEECNGEDYYSEWIGQYSTEAEALALMSSRGFKTYSDIPDSFLTSTPSILARRGDIVLHPSGALGICNGLRSHFLSELNAFTEATLSCPRAWKVQ